ncbi:MAG: hypothetical protein NXI04_11655 [Planctomycetaceae bacterium]|nr:hypothetical protein [Planctomycetaceae bacterium]
MISIRTLRCVSQSLLVGVTLSLASVRAQEEGLDDPRVAIADRAAAGGIDAADVHAAVQKSLPYIAERGQWWIDKKKCISCHRTTFSIWAVAAADRAGLQVNRQQLNEWVDWSYDSLLQPNDDEKIVATTNLDGVAQLLHVTRGLPADEDRITQQQQLRDYLQQGQQDDGSWQPAGQLPSQKRPKPETTWVSTAWIDYFTTAEELDAPHRGRTAAFLAASTPETSTEALIVRMLLADEADRAQVLSSLLNDQQKDGGWGWVRGEESDAMATGQVLWALALHNDSQSADAQRRAVAWLLSQQQDDRWEVKGTKKNKQHRVEETATYWGTCWAVIGLLEATQSAETAAQ